MAVVTDADQFMQKVINNLRLYNDKTVLDKIEKEEMLDAERKRLRHINCLIDKFQSEFGGRSFLLLSSSDCKLQIWQLMFEVKEQTQKWKLFGVIMLNPLDLTLCIRKYMGKVSSTSKILSRLNLSLFIMNFVKFSAPSSPD